MAENHDKEDAGKEPEKARASTSRGTVIATITAAALTATGAIVAAIITGSKPPTPVGSSAPSTSSQLTLSSTPETSSPSTVVSSACSESFAVTAPADMTKISASGGAEFAGTACEGDRIWLLDYDPTDGYYYQVNPEPLPIIAGRWSFHNSPVGNVGDKKGTIYPVVVLRVPAPCSDALKAKAPDSDNTVRFKPLPAGCPDRNDTTHVKTVRLVNDGP